jgi:hypothetical protein
MDGTILVKWDSRSTGLVLWDLLVGEACCGFGRSGGEGLGRSIAAILGLVGRGLLTWTAGSETQTMRALRSCAGC